MRTQRSASVYILLLPILIGSQAAAQLGPRPSEIPQNESIVEPVDQSTVETVELVTEPGAQSTSDETGASASQRARPAIDEMLLAQARAQKSTEEVTQPVSTGSTLQGDLRSADTLSITSSKSPATLVGNESQGSSEQGDSAEGGMGLPSLDSLSSMGDGWGQTIIALSGVLLLILGIAQFYKRLARKQGGLVGQIGAGGTAPSGILEVLGRYPIGTGMTLVVMKFDRRVLLVASGAATRGKHARGATMHTLCELTDAEDVASVLLKARSESGETIARSFERALQDADDLTDDSIYTHDEPVRNSGRVMFPQTQHEPARTITSSEGDRAELWSSDSEGKAAANVLRRRLASMRRGETR